MSRLLLVQGHVNIEAITAEGLCTGLDAAATVAKLRGSTGANGERAWVGDFAARLRDSLAGSSVQVRVVDAIYHRDAFVDWKPDLVLALHFHRDPVGRAMGAIPDSAGGYNSGAAQLESARFLHRWQGGYEVATSIPITPANITLNMTRLYTWCYIDAASAAVILEMGNANVDAAVLYEAGMVRVLRYTSDCIREHFNDLLTPPAAPPPRRTNQQIAADLRRLADELAR